MPRLIELYINNLDEVNAAMTALEKGEVAWSVVVMSAYEKNASTRQENPGMMSPPLISSSALSACT